MKAERERANYGRESGSQSGCRDEIYAHMLSSLERRECEPGDDDQFWGCASPSREIHEIGDAHRCGRVGGHDEGGTLPEVHDPR